MPVFHMTPEESKTIADYFSTVFVDDSIDQLDVRYDEADVRRGQDRFRELGCVGCHQVGLKGGYVGPDLSNTGRRLRPGWIATWLANPQRQKPGTMDPNYGLSAPDIRFLTAYLMSLVQAPPKGGSATSSTGNSR